ncbi:PREDICTED: receptor-like protein 12 [Populus euphratica]|uniref:Receptor-like protein 12 n=1 Tax=Populus euphratica TaxID=75702 RepID=A0AAJ6TQS1_POPEU|nr:PREDICTED: receptor-like protein 12 [Populus euphratica]XP_011015171.1 PREDICTED: receptor-like protein 12 [Populus euphratica]XP_011015172.1 PREDICTED: receptor-like protein 12 [Populus euphratica]XP_011015173.1 PREDICTED: receptor-like protein 12 [Populus euphratica]
MGCLLRFTQSVSLILCLLHFNPTVSSSLSSNFSSSAQLCASDQSIHLLQFKESFVIDPSASFEYCENPKTESWKEGTDCCLWDGVTCDIKSGQVIGLDLACSMLYGPLHSNSTLFSLHHLQKLDLSYNDFNLSHISSQFGHFSNLTHLNLNYSGFTGLVPSQISHLSKLVSLDLSYNNKLALEPIPFNKLVQNLTKLRELHLSEVDMSLVVPSSLMNLSSPLSSLQLANCGLQGKLPSNVHGLSNLQLLDLSENIDLTGSFPPFNVSNALSYLDLSMTGISIHLPRLGNLTQLTVLDISYNNLRGHIPFSIGKLKHLQTLDLGFNNFTSPVPSDFEQLSELVSLDLSGNSYLTLDSSSLNKLVQNLTKLRELRLRWVNMSLVVPASLKNLSSSLSILSFGNCGLRGEFPSNIFLLPNLEFLNLGGNVGLTGSFPSSNVSSSLEELALFDTKISISIENDFINNLKSLKKLVLRNCIVSKRSNLALLGNLTQLLELDLSFNNLSGRIPSSLANLVNLNWLDLSSNNFKGQIPDFLGSLTQLQRLFLSDNQLLGPISPQISSLPNLIALMLSDNLFTGTIPSFLFSHPSLQYLDLRSNLFTGNLSEFQYNSLILLDLSNNHLHGPIPSSVFHQENLIVLKLASNKLTGEISSSACKLTALQVLDLSNNSLSGFIPQCLGNFSDSLSVLHLGMNNLQGTLLSRFFVGNNLRYLNLNGNELEGEIPPSIINCTQLEVLDLGFNKIKGKFPYFFDTLQELQVLVLKSNELHGFVKGPTTNYAFSKLRIFDISSNNFSGPLPTGYFNGLEAMKTLDQDMIYMKVRNISYDYSVKLTWKGLEIEFVKIRSTLAFIDLSHNSFIGEIPESIGKLNALQQLNFSHNSLTGYVQPSLGNLANLESLDLSSNLLTGRIPMQLADLTFLSVLNLSHNQLQGPIPKGKQFNTFNKGSFEGNSGLCGFQISKECNSGETQQPPPSNSEEGDDSSLFGDGFGWKAVVMGYGCGFVLGAAVGYIVFRTRKPAWFVRMVEVQWSLKTKGRMKKAHRNGARRN